MVRVRLKADGISREALEAMRRIILDAGGIIDRIFDFPADDGKLNVQIYIDGTSSVHEAIIGKLILLGAISFE